MNATCFTIQRKCFVCIGRIGVAAIYFPRDNFSILLIQASACNKYIGWNMLPFERSIRACMINIWKRSVAMNDNNDADITPK